jgi:hypothetical protein
MRFCRRARYAHTYSLTRINGSASECAGRRIISAQTDEPADRRARADEGIRVPGLERWLRHSRACADPFTFEAYLQFAGPSVVSSAYLDPIFYSASREPGADSSH